MSEHEAKKPPTLVVIHGVGDSSPGSSLREITAGLGELAGWADRSERLLRGTNYPTLRFEGATFSGAIEVNWSDVARPRASVVSLLDYWLRIVAALLDVSSQQPCGATWIAPCLPDVF